MSGTCRKQVAASFTSEMRNVDISITAASLIASKTAYIHTHTQTTVNSIHGVNAVPRSLRVRRARRAPRRPPGGGGTARDSAVSGRMHVIELSFRLRLGQQITRG